MKCEDALRCLRDTRAGRELRERADAHVAGCSDCRAARLADRVLLRERSIAPPAPAAGAAVRAARAAMSAARTPPADGRVFAKGMLAGAAIAAGVALAIVVSWPGAQGPVPTATPRIAMALNEARAVNIALDAQRQMSGAEIHVLVTGDVELDGYGGQRELRWTTDLATGSNQLTIPVVAIGSSGGQLLVEVEHETKRRRFLVDIEGTG